MWRRRAMPNAYQCGARRSRAGLPRRCSHTTASSPPAPAPPLHEHQLEAVTRTHRGHQSVVGVKRSGKSTAAAQRVLWLQTQPNRRVLALTGRPRETACMPSLLDRATAFHALERSGHRVSGVMEWVQQTLDEFGHEQRMLSFSKLTSFLMHHVQELPLERFHHRVATPSSVHLRRGVGDMLRFFTLLEAHGITPSAYADHVATTLAPMAEAELAEAYRVYRELLARHDVSSWDGSVLTLLEVLARDPHYCGMVTGEFTDVVVDELDRLTPAMVRLVSKVIASPGMQSSTSFSDLAAAGPSTCHRVDQLHSLLSAASPVVNCSTAHWAPEFHHHHEIADRIAHQSLFSGPSTAVGRSSVSPALPVMSLEFASSVDEVRGIASLIHRAYKASVDGQHAPRITVVCPSADDARSISHGLGQAGIHVTGAQALDPQTRHLFDEPGVNTLYSLIVALCYPSETKHLYNVLRSEAFGFSPQSLSLIMERYRREATHATLVEVLAVFVESNGELLSDSAAHGAHSDRSLADDVAAARHFLEILADCRGSCHSKSVLELAELFLERTQRLDLLMAPESPSHAREAIALAAFLREIEAAQRIVQSPYVPFVVPYLQQLQGGRLSAAGGELEQDDSVDDATHAQDGPSVHVVPLTRQSLDGLLHRSEDEESNSSASSDLVVLMAMRDSKFPGRMKRITWPLPTALLQAPLPLQQRTAFLDDCESLVAEFLWRLNPAQLVLSYALVATGGAATATTTKTKHETLSRILLPLWSDTGSNDAFSHDDDSNSNPAATASASAPDPASAPVAAPSKIVLSPYNPSHLSYSQISEYQRCPHRYYLSRVLGLRDAQAQTISMMFGGALHQAIASYATQQQQQQQQVDANAVDGPDSAKRAAFAALEAAWQRTGFVSQEQEQNLLRRAKDALTAWISSESTHHGADEIVAVEQPFECLVHDASDMPVRGVWDRIDHSQERGGVVIREFKSNPSGQRRNHLEAEAAQSLQLQLYMVAYERVHGEPPVGATLEIIGGGDGNGNTGTGGRDHRAVGFVPFTPAVREHVQDVVATTTQAIRRGVFEASPSFFECSMCPFASSACRSAREVPAGPAL